MQCALLAWQKLSKRTPSWSAWGGGQWFIQLKRTRVIVKRKSAQRKCCIHRNVRAPLLSSLLCFLFSCFSFSPSLPLSPFPPSFLPLFSTAQVLHPPQWLAPSSFLSRLVFFLLSCFFFLGLLLLNPFLSLPTPCFLSPVTLLYPPQRLPTFFSPSLFVCLVSCPGVPRIRARMRRTQTLVRLDACASRFPSFPFLSLSSLSIDCFLSLDSLFPLLQRDTD